MSTRRELGPHPNPSFAEVFRRELPAIHRYIRRRVGRDAADDISAATFAAAQQSGNSTRRQAGGLDLS